MLPNWIEARLRELEYRVGVQARLMEEDWLQYGLVDFNLRLGAGVAAGPPSAALPRPVQIPCCANKFYSERMLVTDSVLGDCILTYNPTSRIYLGWREFSNSRLGPATGIDSPCDDIKTFGNDWDHIESGNFYVTYSWANPLTGGCPNVILGIFGCEAQKYSTGGSFPRTETFEFFPKRNLSSPTGPHGSGAPPGHGHVYLPTTSSLSCEPFLYEGTHLFPNNFYFPRQPVFPWGDKVLAFTNNGFGPPATYPHPTEINIAMVEYFP